MNDENAATDTAQTTVEAQEAKGRAELLNQFARMTIDAAEPKPEAQGGEPVEAPEAKAEEQTDETAEQTDDLSQSKTEVEEVATEEAEATTEAEDELTGKLDEHTQQRINKRIAKEVAKTKAEREAREGLERQLQELQQQLEQKAQSETPAVARTGDNPLAHVNTPQALEAEALKAEKAIDQAEEMLETLQDAPEQVEATLRAANVELKDEMGNEDYSLAKMRTFLRGVRRTAQNVVKHAVPERKAYLEQVNVSFSKAQELVPELKDTKSPRYAKFQQVVNSFPALKTQAWWPLAAAVQTIGLETLEKQLAAQKPVEAKAKPPLPVKIPAPKATAPSAPRPKPGSVSDETYQAAIGGDKNARLKVIQSLVPKFS